MEGEVPAARPADANDIAATFRLAADPTLSRETPATADDLLELLRHRHAC